MEVGQSWMVDMRSDAMLIPTELMIYPRKPISEAPNCDLSALQYRANVRSRLSTIFG